MNAAFPELNWQIPQSTYLAWLDLRLLNIDDNALQKALIEQEKVAIMPGYTYGEEGRGLSVSMPAAHVRNWKKVWLD
ncbi:protein MalY [includes: cystathionine beta-lyase; maltose regulon modulator] [Escherichia coli]|uniref:Protein MalY [includes: cystathionine beta-lyase maltose regulon modulator] n=1 Tax=Escherichia coli TaxID=562 RepID=A0A376RIH7_ECOLX|nr:protein MalY [includes: cystathionine beta-lyase; maltose regulon modulator] [Escherichia coli]